MSHHNEALYCAMKAFVSVGIDLITARVDQTSVGAIDADMFFFTRQAASDELRELHEYQRCMDLLLGDSMIASQLDILAGTNSGSRERAPSAEKLMRRVIDLGVRRNPVFDPDLFEMEYAKFEAAYYDSDIVYEVIAPLPTIKISRAINLDCDLEIANSSMEENRGSSFGQTAESSYRFDDEICVIRSLCRLPKVVGDRKEPDHQKRKKDRATESAVHEKIELVINALRLSEIDNAYTSVIIHKPSQWAFDQSRFFPGQPAPELVFTATLEDPWLDGFEAFWKKLRSDGVKKRKFLGIAIRRFGYSHDRQRLVDKMIDLMVAAEALFLSDKNSTGELRYRLSLRAALFLASDEQPQKTIFEWMGKAYDLRSAVAHGREAASVKLPKLSDGSPVGLEQFVRTIQIWIRIAILKAIEIAQRPDAPKYLVDWDGLPFAH